MAWVEVIGTGRSYGASIRVEDVLIVALGDSFISGEGNPDVPADFSAVRPGPGFQRAQWPDRARLPVVRAQWWDEPCHRSLLSWPVLASLYEASRNPRRAVTLVHLGCSGAEVHDGLVEPQNGREPGDSGLPGCPSGQEPRTCPPGGRETQSQLEMLRDLLLAHPESASARPIDRVFLSIGGNDIGFVGVIKYLALPPNGFAGGGLIPRFLLRMPQAEIVCPLRAGDDGRAEATVLRRFCGSRLTAQERLRELPVYYGELRAAFDALQIDPAHIYQTAYPNILEDTPGPAGESRFCQHALTEEAIAALDESRRPAESLYAGNHPDRLYPHGFEAMQGVLPWYLRWRTQWSFHFAHNAGESCHWPAIRSTSSETCKADWVWRELNGALAVRGEENREAVVDGFSRHPTAARVGPFGWNVVTRHVAETRGHGWCRATDEDPLVLPFASRNGRTWEDNRPPSSYQPYLEDRQRWFRTTNDSALTQYGGRDRFHQGTIHPTYRAHIAVAEATVDAAFPAGGE